MAGMQSRRTLNEHERRVVAFHEAGHALCAELLPGVNRVHKISIVPRGKALGYTLNLPEEDRYLKTKEELIDYMSVLLGGRAAEELVFGSITTGAADDLHRVAEISRSMVHDYAMGTSITSRKVSAEGGAVSDRTRQLRDEEQQHLSDEAMRGAMRLISDHRNKLDQLASALLRNEVLERKDIDRIMEGVPRFHRSPGQGLRVVAARRAPTSAQLVARANPQRRPDLDSRPGRLKFAPRTPMPGGDGRPRCPPCAVDARGRRLPRAARARGDPRGLPADRPARRPAADRLRGPGPLPDAAGAGRAAA